MEMQDRISQLSLATFMAEFVPGPDVPSGVTIEAFNPLSFECEGKEMYDEVVSHCLMTSGVLIADSVVVPVQSRKLRSSQRARQGRRSQIHGEE